MEKINNQLLMDFDSARDNFNVASDQLVMVFDRINRSTLSREKKRWARNRMVGDQVRQVRRLIRSIVLRKAGQKKLYPWEAWRVAYGRLLEVTGFDSYEHAEVQGVRKIEAVCRAGYHNELLGVVQAM